MTIQDIHHTHVYTSVQRGSSPEQKRVVSALLTHAEMHHARGRHLSNPRAPMPREASEVIAHAYAARMERSVPVRIARRRV